MDSEGVKKAIRTVAGRSNWYVVMSFTTKSMTVGGVVSLTEQGEVVGHVREKQG